MTLVGTEERNLARLTPVLGLNRVPAAMTGWKKTVQVDQAGMVELTCLSGRTHVVPHGIDGDVMFALTTLYVLQGRPPTGFIRVTVPEFCRTIGLEPNAHTYDRIRQSLERLLHVSYRAFECWGYRTRQGKLGWRSHSFGIVNSLGEEDLAGERDQVLGRYTTATVLNVGLSPELVASIQDGHIRSVDLEFYAALEEPFTRLLYRTLEEQRSLTEQASSFRVPLMAWGDHLGLRGLVQEVQLSAAVLAHTGEIPETEVLSPARLRRALEPAHRELQAKNYLKTVEYVGRGRNQRVDYTFGIPTQPVDLELVALLTQRGVSAPRAEKYVRSHGREAVELATAKFDARKKEGYGMRNRGGLLADMLDNPEKYPDREPNQGVQRVLNAGTRAASHREPEETSTPDRSEKTALVALGRYFEENATMRALRDRAIALYLKGSVSVLDLTQLNSLERAQIERRIEDWEQSIGA